MNNGWYQSSYMNGQENAGMRSGYGQNTYGYTQPMQMGYGYTPQTQQNTPTQPVERFDVIGQGTRVDWVQGEAAMKCYTVRPGTSVILFDMENPKRVYVKAYNLAGAPIYTAGFDLGEMKLGQTEDTNHDDRYVPRDEYEKSMDQIAKMFAGLAEKVDTATKEERHERKNEQAARVGYGEEQPGEYRTEPASNSAGSSFSGI